MIPSSWETRTRKFKHLNVEHREAYDRTVRTASFSELFGSQGINAGDVEGGLGPGHWRWSGNRRLLRESTFRQQHCSCLERRHGLRDSDPGNNCFFKKSRDLQNKAMSCIVAEVETGDLYTLFSFGLKLDFYCMYVYLCYMTSLLPSSQILP